MDNSKDLRLAVLIDADNIPYANIKGMLEEVAKYGTPTFKRIYGDWTKPNLAGWKNVLLNNAIMPVQPYGPCAALPGPNPAGDAMPVAGGSGAEAVPAPRRSQGVGGSAG